MANLPAAKYTAATAGKFVTTLHALSVACVNLFRHNAHNPCPTDLVDSHHEVPFFCAVLSACCHGAFVTLRPGAEDTENRDTAQNHNGKSTEQRTASIDVQADKETGGRRNGWTDRCTGRQTDKQTDTYFTLETIEVLFQNKIN